LVLQALCSAVNVSFKFTANAGLRNRLKNIAWAFDLRLATFDL
jgi:hypothetical protein